MNSTSTGDDGKITLTINGLSKEAEEKFSAEIKHLLKHGQGEKAKKIVIAQFTKEAEAAAAAEEEEEAAKSSNAAATFKEMLEPGKWGTMRKSYVTMRDKQDERSRLVQKEEKKEKKKEEKKEEKKGGRKTRRRRKKKKRKSRRNKKRKKTKRRRKKK
jgi:hypothetical protein